MMQGKVSSRVALDGDARVATGIPGFDEMLEGGYPAGSLITLAGRPGTGKTIFGSQFLYYGAREHGEPGMYVSMYRPAYETKSPPSPTTIASRSSRRRNSPYTRTGSIGDASDSRRAWSDWRAACSWSPGRGTRAPPTC